MATQPQTANLQRTVSNALEIHDLTKVYQIPVIQQLSLTVRQSEFLCLIGPNGCGKTTLLRILAGLEKPSEGYISINGQAVDLSGNYDHHISVVFQEARLLPWKSILDNIVLCLDARGVPHASAVQTALHYLQLVGLTGFEHYYPSRVSGGMQQRAAIARALAVEPQTLLMDEPFSALDPENRRIMQEEVVSIWKKTRKTIIFVTHSIDEALRIGTRVVLLTARPARVHATFELDDQADRRGLHDKLLEMLSEQLRLQRQLASESTVPKSNGSEPGLTFPEAEEAPKC